MSSFRPANNSMPLTLWVVNLPDREVRCVIDAGGTETPLEDVARKNTRNTMSDSGADQPRKATASPWVWQ